VTTLNCSQLNFELNTKIKALYTEKTLSIIRDGMNNVRINESAEFQSVKDGVLTCSLDEKERSNQAEEQCLFNSTAKFQQRGNELVLIEKSQLLPNIGDYLLSRVTDLARSVIAPKASSASRLEMPWSPLMNLATDLKVSVNKWWEQWNIQTTVHKLQQIPSEVEALQVKHAAIKQTLAETQTKLKHLNSGALKWAKWALEDFSEDLDEINLHREDALFELEQLHNEIMYLNKGVQQGLASTSMKPQLIANKHAHSRFFVSNRIQINATPMIPMLSNSTQLNVLGNQTMLQLRN